jgi:hypothetical protein
MTRMQRACMSSLISDVKKDCGERLCSGKEAYKGLDMVVVSTKPLTCIQYRTTFLSIVQTLSPTNQTYEPTSMGFFHHDDSDERRAYEQVDREGSTCESPSTCSTSTTSMRQPTPVSTADGFLRNRSCACYFVFRSSRPPSPFRIVQPTSS